MAENPQPPTPEAPPKPATDADRKFAGKYDTPEELESGYREARQTLGLDPLPDTQPVFGKNGFFIDVQAAERGYKDLEKMISAGAHRAAANQPAPPPKPQDQTPGQPPSQDTIQEQLSIQPKSTGDQGLDALLQKAGVTSETVLTEWSQRGQLSDATYRKFKAVGLERPVVDLGLRGLMAEQQMRAQQAETMRNRQIELAGGEQQRDELFQKAQAELPPARIQDLNRRLVDPNLYEGAMTELVATFNGAVGAGASQGNQQPRPMVQGGQRPAQPSGQKIETIEEFEKVNKAAAAGDPAALARLRSAQFDDLLQLQ